MREGGGYGAENEGMWGGQGWEPSIYALCAMSSIVHALHVLCYITNALREICCVTHES